MKKVLLLAGLAFLGTTLSAQNVGIGTPAPATALDVIGGFRVQPKAIVLNAANFTIPNNESNILLVAGYAGDFSITINAAQTGQRLIIDNQTGYIGAIEQDEIIEQGMNEFIYSLGKWKIVNKAVNSWKLTGNAGTTVDNYIGTSDAQPIRFRTHGNRNAGFLDNVRYNYHVGGGLPTSLSYTGSRNVSLGYLSSSNLEAGSDNVSLGFYSLFSNKAGTDNVAIGTWAMRFNKTGSGNVAIGQYALQRDTSANGNVAIGSQALQFNDSRNGNTAIGSAALQYNTNTGSVGSSQGELNTAIGAYSLNKNLRGSGAIAIGAYAAFRDTAAEGIVAIGRGALFNNIGRAGNLAIGDSALYANTLGATVATHAISNTGIGSKAMNKNTTGSNNTSLGFNALYNNTIGYQNTAIGSNSMRNNINGLFNVSIGDDALRHSNGNGNTAVGSAAMFLNQTGNDNVAIGGGTLAANINGSNNIAIGIRAGFNELGSNKLYIDNAENSVSNDKDNALIYGDFAADSLLLNAKTVVRNNAVLRGFTKLGGYSPDVPSIKMKKMVIPAGPAVNSLTNYPFGGGITDSKVLGIEVLMRYDASTSKIPPGYIDTPGYEYNVQVQFNGITIINKVGNSANIGGRPITVVVTYEE